MKLKCHNGIADGVRRARERDVFKTRPVIMCSDGNPKITNTVIPQKPGIQD